MLLIDCPYCGKRPELEFAYGGQAHIARPVVLERPPDQVYAVRQQRGGERIALKTFVGPAVETELQRSRTVDASAARRAECAHGR